MSNVRLEFMRPGRASARCGPAWRLLRGELKVTRISYPMIPGGDLDDLGTTPIRYQVDHDRHGLICPGGADSH